MVVADDSVIIREGLGRLLAGSPTIEVVAQCEDLPSLVDAVEREGPDVVITDIRMPPPRPTRAFASPPRCASATPGSE